MNRFIKYLNEKNQESYWHLYGMVESIKPIKTKYKILKNSDEIDIEFYDDYTKSTYKVLFRKTSSNKAEVVFGEKSQFDLDSAVPEDLKTGNNKPFKVLGKVLYIVIDILKKRKDIEYIYFTAFGPDLKNIYDKMVKNKYFLEELEKEGFVYNGFSYNEYVFKRIHR